MCYRGIEEDGVVLAESMEIKSLKSFHDTLGNHEQQRPVPITSFACQCKHGMGLSLKVHVSKDACRWLSFALKFRHFFQNPSRESPTSKIKLKESFVFLQFSSLEFFLCMGATPLRPTLS